MRRLPIPLPSARCAATAMLLAAPAAWAADGARLAAHQLWVGHGLAALVVALLAYQLSRWWALAGIALVVALWYAFAQVGGGSAAAALQQFGPRYPFHVNATAMLLPLAVLAGIGARWGQWGQWGRG